eukprot:11201408-Lingulodinium_polyedra.AAC.1
MAPAVNPACWVLHPERKQVLPERGRGGDGRLTEPLRKEPGSEQDVVKRALRHRELLTVGRGGVHGAP